MPNLIIWETATKKNRNSWRGRWMNFGRGRIVYGGGRLRVSSGGQGSGQGCP